MKHSVDILSAYNKKKNRNNAYGVFEETFPAYVIPLYSSTTSGNTIDITICSSQTKTYSIDQKPVLNFVICQDVPINLIKIMLTNNILYHFFTIFGSYASEEVGQVQA